MVSKRKRYSREIKIETVRLVTASDNSVTEVANDLEIYPNMLYEYIHQYSENRKRPFPGKENRPPRQKKSVVSVVIFHSNRGSQYTCFDFQSLLVKNGMRCSMSRRGYCWDNTPIESFFGGLKHEFVFHQRYVTHFHARQSIFEYIKRFYNRYRLQSTLGYKSPANFEAIYFKLVA